MTVRKSFYNLIFGFLSIIIGLVFQIILMFLIIKFYGSRLNGLVKTIMSMTAFIGSTESGIGIMCSVFLFKPIMNKDWIKANQIINTAHRQNRILGLISIVLLAVIMIAYSAYIIFAQGNFDTVEIVNKFYTVNFWVLLIIVFFIGSKNIISLFWNWRVWKFINCWSK